MRHALLLIPIAAILLSAGPAAARGWNLDKDEQGRPVFAYGGEEEVLVVLTCRKGGQVSIEAELLQSQPSDAQIAAATKVPHYAVKGGAQLKSGGLTRTLPASMTINQEAGIWEARVTLPAADPLLAAFAKGGTLTFSSTGDTETYTLKAADRVRFSRFLAACK
jgi:hypothetical protein